MRSLRGSSLPDRRAARLVALTTTPPNRPSEGLGPLSARGIAAFRAALAGCAREDAGHQAPASARVAAAVRDLVEEARAGGVVHGEQLLIAFKRAWTTLPDVQALPPGGAREAAWDRLVALSVRAFYAPARRAPDSPHVLRLVSNPSDRAIQP